MRLGLLVIVLGCAGCAFHGDTVKGSADYRALWKRSWERIALDSAAYRATARSPGACDRGSTMQACLAADQRTYADVGTFLRALARVETPFDWIHPGVMVKSGLSLWESGLYARIQSLAGVSGTLDRRWSSSEIAQGRSTIVQAWATFPDSARSLLVEPAP